MLNRKSFKDGNYSNYYGYRTKDTRINFMNSEWFTDKSILDIGCNSGMLTRQIANEFKIKSIIGIDKDYKLIKKARSDLKREWNFDCKIYFTVTDIMTHDFSYQFDTVLALSITKWIHLNNGDEGIMKFFKIVQDCLTLNGIFIIEPQPFKSYRKRKKLSEAIEQNYLNIRIKPKDFNRILCDQFEFELIDSYEPLSEEGFDRPIYVFKKISKSYFVMPLSSFNNV